MDTKALRQKILDMAIRGKLVPQKSSDDPAKELLEKIRKEKEQMVKDKKLKPKDVKDDTVIYKDDDGLYYEKFNDGTVKCIQEEIPFEIPESWEWSKLKNLTSKEIKRGKSAKYSEESSTLVFAQKCNLKAGGINLELAKYLDGNTLKKYSAEEFLQENDTVINSTGTGTLGRVGIIKELNEKKVVPDSHVTTIRPWKSVDKNYIYYFLKKNQKYLESKGEGSTNQKELKPITIKEILIPLPGKLEQQRIVNKIEDLFEQIEIIEKEKEELQNLTKVTKSKILDLAIRGELTEQKETDQPAAELLQKIREEKEQMVKDKKLKPKDVKNDTVIYKAEDGLYYEKFKEGTVKCIQEEIPFDISQNWKWVRLGNIGMYKKGPFGSTITKKIFVPKSNDTIKIYEQKNAIQKDWKLGNYYVTQKYFEDKLKGFEVFEGDIIVSCAGTIGETYIMPAGIERGVINQALMRMKIFDGINVDYFLMYFDSILKDSAKESSQGSAIKNIPPLDIFKKMFFAIPPLEEQQRIVNKIEELFEQIDAIEEELK